MGIRGIDNTSNPGFGEQGDSFIYSSIVNNGLNIISQAGSGTDDYIRFYAGQLATTGNTPDLYIQGSGSTRGYVGIGTATPSERLEVSGNTKISEDLFVGDTIYVGNVTGTPTTPASLYIRQPSITGSSESPIIDIQVDDANSYFRINNATATDGFFTPSIITRQSDSPDRLSLFFDALVEDAQDTPGAADVMRFRARRDTPDFIQNRNLYAWYNYTTRLMDLDKDGNLDIIQGGLTVNGNTTITGSLIVTTSVTASSYTGSFVGDGSQLTGIISSKWSGSNPITRDSDVEITGSLNVTGGVTASLFGTASWAENALTASYALTSSFAQSGNGNFSGSFSGSFEGDGSQLTGIVSSKWSGSNPITRDSDVEITGSFRVEGQTTLFTTGSGTLKVQGSGSDQPIFTVQGSSGELFSITDNLSGSLFSVNDISGLPILEVFSDNTVLIGDYQAPALYTTKRVTSVAGNNVIYSLTTSSYDGAFFDYVAKSGSNARAGNIMALWSGTSVNFTETTTTDFGSTSGLAFTVFISGSNLVLSGSTSTANWNIKTIIRSI
jgi:hypothetical protein